MQAAAPGKVILTGEHSVVYGKPAVAMAIDAHVSARLVPAPQGHDWSVKLVGRKAWRFTAAELPALILDIDQRFDRFLANDLSIRSVLPSPEALLIYSLAQGARESLQTPLASLTALFERLPPHTLTTHSTIHAGGGMGSSAAAIAAAVRLGEALAEQTLSVEERMERVGYCERLQHGRGSKIDASAVSFGGKVVLQNGIPTPQSLPNLSQGWYLVNTGRAKVSTGECVSYVREHHGSSDIWAEFENVSQGFLADLAKAQLPLARIKENHRLLQRLGVVPKQVARFIELVELNGGAAKVSGSGAHKGQNAGLVLVCQPDMGVLQRLCKRFGYKVWPLKEDPHGARLLSH